MRISSWNFVRVTKACDFRYCVFKEIILESSRNVGVTIPWTQMYKQERFYGLSRASETNKPDPAELKPPKLFAEM